VGAHQTNAEKAGGVLCPSGSTTLLLLLRILLERGKENPANLTNPKLRI